MKYLYFLILIITLNSCSTPRLVLSGEDELFESHFSQEAYEEQLEDKVRHFRGYEGFDNIFQFHVVLVDSKLMEAQSRRNSDFYQWSTGQLRESLQKNAETTSKGTTLFLSFYTPTPKHNDLQRPNSIWEIYLQVNGTRYRGRAKKLTDPVAKIQALYSFHDSWSTAYEVTFVVPSSVVENNESKFTITGTLGAGETIL